MVSLLLQLVIVSSKLFYTRLVVLEKRKKTFDKEILMLFEVILVKKGTNINILTNEVRIFCDKCTRKYSPK